MKRKVKNRAIRMWEIKIPNEKSMHLGRCINVFWSHIQTLQIIDSLVMIQNSNSSTFYLVDDVIKISFHKGGGGGEGEVFWKKVNCVY